MADSRFIFANLIVLAALGPEGLRLIAAFQAGLLAFLWSVLPSRSAMAPVALYGQTVLRRGIQLQAQLRTLTGFPCVGGHRPGDYLGLRLQSYAFICRLPIFSAKKNRCSVKRC
jgi:hypothetical protein